MAKIFFKKGVGNIWVPDDEQSVEVTASIKVGTVLGGEFTKPANYQFFKKMHALVRLTFDRFTENLDTGLEFRGMKCEPSYELFRKQMTILAGYYTCHYDIQGRAKVEAKSWSFSGMSEEDRERMFSALINVALRKFFAAQLSEQKLRELVDQIMGFA